MGPMKETYENERNLWKRPMKETYERDLYKSPIQETYESDVYEKSRMMCEQSCRSAYDKYVKRALEKRPMKEKRPMTETHKRKPFKRRKKSPEWNIYKDLHEWEVGCLDSTRMRSRMPRLHTCEKSGASTPIRQNRTGKKMYKTVPNAIYTETCTNEKTGASTPK